MRVEGIKMKITESQLRRVIKRLINEQAQYPLMGVSDDEEYAESKYFWFNKHYQLAEPHEQSGRYSDYAPRGYRVGTRTYRKKDGTPITDEDFQKLLGYNAGGQVTSWTRNKFDPEHLVDLYVEDDSTD